MKNFKAIPARIRGRVGQAEDPPEMIGKWFAELEMAMLGEGNFKRLATIGPFETESEAKKALKESAELAVKKTQEAFGVEPSGCHYDMKTNKLHKSFFSEN